MNPWIAWVLGMPVGAAIVIACLWLAEYHYDREIERIGSPGDGEI